MIALAIVVAIIVLLSITFGYYLGATRNRNDQTGK